VNATCGESWQHTEGMALPRWPMGTEASGLPMPFLRKRDNK